MDIETGVPEASVHVSQAGQSVELAIGAASDPSRRTAVLSVPQAEMLLHSLGLTIARMRERDRLEAQEKSRLAATMIEQEFRRG
jgi:hypothetical protein